MKGNCLLLLFNGKFEDAGVCLAEDRRKTVLGKVEQEGDFLTVDFNGVFLCSVEEWTQESENYCQLFHDSLDYTKIP